MDAESSICLSDLVPALRWSRPRQIAEVLADPRMPAGWWGSVTLPRAMAVMGMDWLCDRLSRLSVTLWDHLPIIELMPALQVHNADPALPGMSEQVRTAVTGLGGWARVRRLAPADLKVASGPASPEAVLSAMYREALSRIPAHRSLRQDAAAAAPAAPAAPPRPQTPAPAAPQTPAVPQAPAVPPQAPAPAVPQAPAVPSAPAASGSPATTTTPHPAVTGRTPLPSRPQPATPQTPSQAPQPAAAAQAPAQTPAPVDISEHPLVGLVDSMFREWQPLEQAVAVERLFAANPISLRELAHRLDVDREVLSLAQRSAEERVLLWLRSPASSPLTGHLFRLTEWLGAAATEEQLIGADPAHPVIVPILRTPLWRVLVTLMPDRRLQDGWLVVGDLNTLRERTRQMLANKPADADVVELLAQFGIRPHSAQAWLESLGMSESASPASSSPASEQRSTAPATTGSFPAQLPRRTPGANAHPRNGTPIPQVNRNIDPSAALATLSALSGNNGNGGGPGRPHLTPARRPGAPSAPPSSLPGPAADPRRWQRIEVTSEHLRGEPVAVPENYAAQLGMRPGTLLSVTGPGDNAVVLVWRDRQPVFDSLQPVLMRLNARPGDEVYVTVNGYRLEAQIPRMEAQLPS